MNTVRAFVVALLVLTGLAVPSGPFGPLQSAASAAVALPGSLYAPLPAPVRILDTRTDTGGHPGQVTHGETVALAVPGLPADATAVAINLTGTRSSASTYLSAFPGEFTGTSTLNLAAGQTAAVAAIVTLGEGQRIKIFNHAGAVDVIADLTGYFATGAAATFASSPTPVRLLDTRTSTGGHLGPLAPGEALTLPVRGRAGVPADATAVVVNVTGVLPTSNTYLAVTPAGQPGTSTLNLDAGAIRANLAIVGIGDDGAIRLRNNAGSTHAVVDLQAWFGPGAGGRYMPLPAPYRVLDTRASGGPVGAGQTRVVPFTGSGIPAQGRVAALFTLTGVTPTAATHLTAWPHGRPRPLASNVNLGAGAIVPNLAVSDTSTVDVYNNAGTTHLVVDAAGYFYTPTSADPTVPGAPTVTAVGPSGDRVRVAWTATADGGLPITGYTVTAQPGGVTVSVDGSWQEARIAGLVPGVTYRMTVTATNYIGTGPASGPSAPVSPTSMTMVETDSAGVPDQSGNASFRGALSGSGRYALLWVRSDSNLVPAAFRTVGDQGQYLVRKDLQSGEVILAGITPAGTALRTNFEAAIDFDGTTLAYSSWVGDGPSVLYVRDLVAGTVRPVFTDAAGLFPDGPTVTRDGLTVIWATGGRIYRHHLPTGQTSVLLECPSPTTGCYLYTSPVVSGDGTVLLFKYRATPTAPIRPHVLNTVTETFRLLVDVTEDVEGFTLSGNGQWAFYTVGFGCPSCGGGSFQLKRVATAQGSTPVLLRSWEDTVTWGVYPSTADEHGTVVGYFRQTGESGRWFAAARGYMYDVLTQREILMPDSRDTTYTQSPIISTNGRMAVLQESCLWATACSPVRSHVISLTELR